MFLNILVILFVLVPLALLLFFIIKHQKTLHNIYKIRQQQKEAQERAEEERQRQERVRRHTHPEQSSVDLIKGTHMDLDGGEYVDFEEVSDEK